MKIRKIIVIIMSLVALVIGVCVVLIGFEQPPVAPNISVTPRSYTNDVNGVRLARFTVTNLGPSSIRWGGTCKIQFPTPTGWTNQSIGFLVGNGIIGSGNSGTFTIPSPTNDSPWRISFIVYPDAGPSQAVKWAVTTALMRVGLKPRYRMMRYEMYGYWSPELESVPSKP